MTGEPSFGHEPPGPLGARPCVVGMTRQPRNARCLRRRADFLRVQNSTARVASRHFLFLVAPSPKPTLCRMGIAVSRKIGAAVVRNRAKRLVREAFRRIPDLVPQGIDIVVIVRSPLIGLKLQDVLGEWARVSHLVGRRACAVRSKQEADREDCG